MRTQEDGTPFQKIICKNEYKTFLLSGTRGTEIMLKLSRMFLPAIGVALDGFFSSENSAKKDIMDMDINISSMAMKLAEGIDIDSNVQIIKDLLNPCERNGKQVDFDFDYRGKYQEMFQALQWVIELNYGDFFLSLFKEKLTTRLKEARKKASKSLNT